MTSLWILFCRSVLEQSCVVWHSSLTAEDSNSLERIQKSAVKIILGNQYKNYEEALEKINLEPLNERRNVLCLKFAKKCLKNKKVSNIFPTNEKISSNGIKKLRKICC